MRVFISEWTLPSTRDRGHLFPSIPQVNEEEFSRVLMEMGVPVSLLTKMIIIIEARNMVQSSYGGRSGCTFLIYLRYGGIERRDSPSVNAVIAHELKHIWYDITKPSKQRVMHDGFSTNRRPYRWEELDCRRAEKKYGNAQFLVFPEGRQ